MENYSVLQTMTLADIGRISHPGDSPWLILSDVDRL